MPILPARPRHGGGFAGICSRTAPTACVRYSLAKARREAEIDEECDDSRATGAQQAADDRATDGGQGRAGDHGDVVRVRAGRGGDGASRPRLLGRAARCDRPQRAGSFAQYEACGHGGGATKDAPSAEACLRRRIRRRPRGRRLAVVERDGACGVRQATRSWRARLGGNGVDDTCVVRRSRRRWGRGVQTRLGQDRASGLSQDRPH